MAQRRMFSKSITNSSQFLMMPQSSQNLYFHLGMNADDDGFCEHFSIMRMTDSKPDDLKVLQAKGFVSVFDDRVLVVTAWRENNYLRSDRYSPSKYLRIYKNELALLSHGLTDTTGIPDGNQMATQVRLGKVRLGKETQIPAPKDAPLVVSVIDAFEAVNPAFKKWYARPPQRDAARRLIETHGLEQVLRVIKMLPISNQTPYFPAITTPLQLEDGWAKLKAAWDRKKNESLSGKHGIA